MTSKPSSRFLTGFQIVRVPTPHTADEWVVPFGSGETVVRRNAFGVGPFDPEPVVDFIAAAGGPRQVDHDAGHGCPSPPVGGSDAGVGRVTRQGIVAIEIGPQLMERTGDLRGAPGLIDPQAADDVGSLRPGIVAG